MSQRRLTREARKLQPFVANTAGFVVSDAITGDKVPIDHGQLDGLADDDHPQYSAIGQNETIAGQWSFNDSLSASNILPRTTDTYDLGSSLKLWRKAYVSELDAVVFAENTITLLGGWLLVSKDEGKLGLGVAAGDTQIDFGKAMTPNDFVLFRAAGQVEYMKVGTLVSGTIYNVTRNLDGSGANNWTDGSVFAVLGQTGDGRIELNAYDTPRISIIEQGATYNAQTERLRLGDMVDAFGTGANHRYGIGIGDYAGGNYLSYNAEAANAFLLKAGGGAVLIDDDGISLVSGATDQNALKFVTGTHVDAYIYGGAGNLSLTPTPGVADKAGVSLRGEDGSGMNSDFYVDVDADIGLHVHAAFSQSVNIRYMGELQSERNGTYYPVYGFHPLTTPLTSTSFDGDAFSTTAKTKIDLSAVFGAPAGVKAVLVRARVSDSASAATNGLYCLLSPNNTAGNGPFLARPSGLPNNFYVEMDGIVPCDANGDIYYQIVASGADTMTVILQIWGYWI